MPRVLPATPLGIAGSSGASSLLLLRCPVSRSIQRQWPRSHPHPRCPAASQSIASLFTFSCNTGYSRLNHHWSTHKQIGIPRTNLVSHGVAGLVISTLFSSRQAQMEFHNRLYSNRRADPGLVGDKSSPTCTDHGTDECVFFFDIDNCMYSKQTGIPELMKERIEKYFRDSGIPQDEVEELAYRYYVDYGLAIRGLVEKHPEIDIADYDDKVDGALPLESILQRNGPLRAMIQSMTVGKKWLFTNAGESHANRVISILGLQGLFDGMTYCNYLEPQFVCKPDRKAFEKAMRQAGVSNPALCYFVDDSAPNIDMATKMGWTAVHVNEYPSLPSTSGKFQIRSVMDLPKVLPRFWEF